MVLHNHPLVLRNHSSVLGTVMGGVLGADGVTRILLEAILAHTQPGTVGKVTQVAVVSAIVQVGIPGLRCGESLNKEAQCHMTVT